MLSGIGALGLTKPGAGSDAMGSIKTTARKDGVHYVLNGRKIFIANGPLSDLLLIYARTNPEWGQQGFLAFVMEKDMAGFPAAQSLKTMDWRGRPTGKLLFDDRCVPAEDLIGGKDKAVKLVISGLDIWRAFLSRHFIAFAQRALNLSLDHARTRQQFDQPIAGFHMVQGVLADVCAALEFVPASSYQVLKEVAADEAGRGRIQERTAAALLHAGQMLQIVLDHVM